MSVLTKLFVVLLVISSLLLVGATVTAINKTEDWRLRFAQKDAAEKLAVAQKNIAESDRAAARAETDRVRIETTAAINLRTSQQQWISKTVHEDGQHNPAAVYYGSSGARGPDGEPIISFLPRGPRSPHGRTAPAIAGGRLLFTEGFGALTCVESAR